MTATTTDARTMLAVDDLVVDHGRSRALFGVSCAVPEGGVLAVLGPNGAGKSTLGAAISGLSAPTSGRVEVAGQDVTGWPAHRRARLGVTHVLEARGVFPGLSVLDNLRLGVRRAVAPDERGATVDRALDLFPPLAARRKLPAASLSGGERQMLALARVLAAPPRLLIADEPSLGLAPMLAEAVFEILEQARAQGVTIVLVEQFVERAVRLADRAVVLRRGRVVWQGAAGEAEAAVLEHYLGPASDHPTALSADPTISPDPTTSPDST